VTELLARDCAAALLEQPSLAGRALPEVAGGVRAAMAAIEGGEPAEARRAIAGPRARADLARFRIPCLSRGRGAIGVGETSEAGGATDGAANAPHRAEFHMQVAVPGLHCGFRTPYMHSPPARATSPSSRAVNSIACSALRIEPLHRWPTELLIGERA